MKYHKIEDLVIAELHHKNKDYSNLKIGESGVVIGYKGKSRWYVRCSCGKIFDTDSKLLSENNRDGKINGCFECYKNRKNIKKETKISINEIFIGQKIGTFTIIDKINKPGKTKYTCRCDCGRDKVISRAGLKKTKSPICECSINKPRVDYIGTVIGERGIVIAHSHRGPHDQNWIVRCGYCDKDFIASTKAIKGSKRLPPIIGCISCTQSFIVFNRNLKYVGQKFGKLTVLSRAKSNGENSYVICKCDCMGITKVRLSEIVSGRTQSCGCQQLESTSSDYIGNRYIDANGLSRLNRYKPSAEDIKYDALLRKRFRKAVIKRDNFTCNKCMLKLGWRQLEAHHLNNYKDYIEERYCIDNGVTLCSKCHTEFHQKYGYHGTSLIDSELFLGRKINSLAEFEVSSDSR